MELIFKKLVPELCDNYLEYFEHIGFKDNESFSACYCLESHVSKAEDERLNNRPARRNAVRQLIEVGIMQGYLIYDDENIIGWCNVGDKGGYLPLQDSEYHTVDLKNSKVKALYCIEIAPDYRGKGISHKIVDKVCADARAEGYDYIEAYPFLDKAFAYQYHGPICFYEVHGFTKSAERSKFCIMRKKLKSND